MEDKDLWKLLDLYEGAKPSAGVKSRVLANIRKPFIFRYLVPLAAAAGILIAIFVANDLTKTAQTDATINEEDEIAENLELLANYELVQYIDLLEDDDTLNQLEEFVQ